MQDNAVPCTFLYVLLLGYCLDLITMHGLIKAALSVSMSRMRELLQCSALVDFSSSGSHDALTRSVHLPLFGNFLADETSSSMSKSDNKCTSPQLACFLVSIEALSIPKKASAEYFPNLIQSYLVANSDAFWYAAKSHMGKPRCAGISDTGTDSIYFSMQ
jgi:hypothetical protein